MEGRSIQVPDVLADPDYTKNPDSDRNFRTILGVPLVGDGTVIGAIILTRTIVQPFTPRQVALVTASTGIRTTLR
jgi:GAF domain-containing protein